MNVLLDARVLGDPATANRGVGRYTRCLLEALHAEGYPVAPLTKAFRPPTPVPGIWEHALMAPTVKRRRPDLVHSPSLDLVSLNPGAPLVVTLHDLAPMKRKRSYLRTGGAYALRYRAVKKAAAVIVPSRATAEDARELLGIDTHVIPEAADPRFAPVEDPAAVLARLHVPPRFLLWVGGLDPPDPRKNVEALAAAVAADPKGLPLVLAGRTDHRARHIAAAGRVILTGRVSDEELAALYTAASALVVPSEDEGFGLPAVEALACGTPVAASAAGALPEVLEGAEGYELVEPGDLEALLAAAQRLAGTEAKPPERTWNEVAKETWAVYEQAASLPSGRAPDGRDRRP